MTLGEGRQETYMLHDGFLWEEVPRRDKIVDIILHNPLKFHNKIEKKRKILSHY